MYSHYNRVIFIMCVTHFNFLISIAYITFILLAAFFVCVNSVLVSIDVDVVFEVSPCSRFRFLHFNHVPRHKEMFCDHDTVS